MADSRSSSPGLSTASRQVIPQLQRGASGEKIVGSPPGSMLMRSEALQPRDKAKRISAPKVSVDDIQRQTCDFPPNIQAFLKESISLSEGTDAYRERMQKEIEDGTWQKKVDKRTAITLGSPMANHPIPVPESSLILRASPEQPSHERSASNSAHSSLGTPEKRTSDPVEGTLPITVSNRNTTLYTQVPVWNVATRLSKYTKQLEAVLDYCEGNLCRAGWKCWETDATCGGIFVEQPDGTKKYQHRDPILKNEISIGQFVLCLSFFRRCIKSTTSSSSDTFLRAIDLYISSCLQNHVCSVPLVCLVEDELDAAAKRYAQGLPLDVGENDQVQQRIERVPRGIVIAAAMSLDCIKMKELVNRAGTSVPIYVEPPKTEQTFISPRSRAASSAEPQSPNGSSIGSSFIRKLSIAPKRTDSPRRDGKEQ